MNEKMSKGLPHRSNNIIRNCYCKAVLIHPRVFAIEPSPGSHTSFGRHFQGARRYAVTQG